MVIIIDQGTVVILINDGQVECCDAASVVTTEIRKRIRTRNPRQVLRVEDADVARHVADQALSVVVARHLGPNLDRATLLDVRETIVIVWIGNDDSARGKHGCRWCWAAMYM